MNRKHVNKAMGPYDVLISTYYYEGLVYSYGFFIA